MRQSFDANTIKCEWVIFVLLFHCHLTANSTRGHRRSEPTIKWHTAQPVFYIMLYKDPEKASDTLWK